MTEINPVPSLAPESFIARPANLQDRLIRGGLMLANLTLFTLLCLAMF